MGGKGGTPSQKVSGRVQEELAAAPAGDVQGEQQLTYVEEGIGVEPLATACSAEVPVAASVGHSGHKKANCSR